MRTVSASIDSAKDEAFDCAVSTVRERRGRRACSITSAETEMSARETAEPLPCAGKDGSARGD
jgi:hypothetical protein